MPTQRIVGLLLLLTCAACRTGTYMADPGTPVDAVAEETPRDLSEEIAQCEATGTSDSDCYDSHFVAPPKPPEVAVSIVDMADLARHTLWVAKHEAAHQAHTR
jgi:hypothetical protein